MFQRILVPLDGSPLAERALPIAARIARASHGSLLLLRVVSTLSQLGMYMADTPILMGDTIDEELTAAASYLADKAKAHEFAGINIETAVFSGIAASHILDVAQHQQVDLVVMCSHGKTGFERWVLGSVAQKIARHSPVPVFVLNGRESRPSNLFQEGTHPVRALVTLNGSLQSEAVLEPVAQLVTALSTPAEGALHLLRVVDIPANYGVWEGQALVDTALLKEASQEAETYLRLIVERLHTVLPATLQFTITTSVQVEADVASTILRTAEHYEDGRKVEKLPDYDLIAMATHGRSGLVRWALGSVTERVLETTKLSMLVVRSQEKKAHSSTF